MIERTIPAEAHLGRKTPVFTPTSVPPALLKAHYTTVWAELTVVAGSVGFTEEEPNWHVVVPAGGTQPIVPNRKHHVTPSDDAEFYVQFYDR